MKKYFNFRIRIMKINCGRRLMSDFNHRGSLAMFSLLILFLASAAAQNVATTPGAPPVNSSESATPPVVGEGTTPVAETPVLKALPVPKGPVAPPSPPLPLDLSLPAPGGPVEEFVGHRKTDKDGSGWGWIKKANEEWRKAHWVTLRETVKSPAPWRALGSKVADEDFEYKIWGYFANHQAYDPIYDEMLDVFVLDHAESLGVTKPLERRPGPKDRFMHGHASSAGSRADRPVQSDDQAF